MVLKDFRIWYSHVNKSRCCCCSIAMSRPTLWTAACRAPLSLGLSQQAYWNGLPYPSPGDLLYPGMSYCSVKSTEEGSEVPCWVWSFFACHKSRINCHWITIKVNDLHIKCKSITFDHRDVLILHLKICFGRDVGQEKDAPNCFSEIILRQFWNGSFTFWSLLYLLLGLPGSSVVKIPPANAGDTGDASLIPGVRKIPWRRA